MSDDGLPCSTCWATAQLIHQWDPRPVEEIYLEVIEIPIHGRDRRVPPP